MHLPFPADNRLRLGLTAGLIAVGALVAGAAIGAGIVAPLLADGSSAHSRAPAFAMRLDQRAVNPDPPVYRTPTPKFDDSGPPPYAALAKKKAQDEIAKPPRTREASDTHRWSSQYPVRDRITGVIY